MEIFGRDLVNWDRLGELGVSFALNIFVLVVIVWIAYGRKRDKPEYVFTFSAVNILVFAVSFLMTSVDLGIGVGFGLFALFAIMRFRTETLPVVEMSYLFAVFAVAVINSLGLSALSLVELVVIDVVITVALLTLGSVWLRRQDRSATILYERIENIRPDRYTELISDLRVRTGLDIRSATVADINFLNDTARVTVRYSPTGDHPSLVNGQFVPSTNGSHPHPVTRTS